MEYPVSAFPHQALENEYGQHIVPPSTGMTLRDYFAGCVLSSLDITEFFDGSHKDLLGTTLNGFAIICYKMADAMMEAREA